MGIFQNEIAELVQRYLKAAHNRDMEIREILQQPWHKVVGLSWRARVYFKEPGWYASEDEVPDPKPETYYIYLGSGKMKEYVKLSGMWIEQDMTEDMYKD